MYKHDPATHPASSLKPLVAVPASSVRGQLDPPSQAKATKGWRHIQCADSPNELRVLIPPRPAAIYANLLKVEAYALRKNDAEYLRYIRHLKEAMVKKCQKLVQQTIMATPDSQPIRHAPVVEAPLDFRLKRLEQWWEEMESRGRSKSKSDPSKRQRGQSTKHASTSKAGDSSGRGHKPSSSIHIMPSAPLAQTSLVRKQSTGRLTESPNHKRKKPPHLTMSTTGHPGHPHPSPSMPRAPQTPVRPIQNTPIQIAYSQSSHTQSPRNPPAWPLTPHSPAYAPLYANSHSASPSDTLHNPYFDPNHSLASQTVGIHSSPNAHGKSTPGRHNITLASYSPPHSRDTVEHHGNVQADPSLLKSQFRATYMISPSNSNYSPPSNASKPSSSPQYPALDHDDVGAYTQAGSRQAMPTRSRPHKSYTAPHSAVIPSHSTTYSPPTADTGHNRRATVGGDDTDRSVRRPKGYMYSSPAAYGMQRDDTRSDPYPHDNTHDSQRAHQLGSDHSPSSLRRMTRFLNQRLTVTGSPLSSGSPSGSPRSQGSVGVVVGSQRLHDSTGGSPYEQRTSPVRPAVVPRQYNGVAGSGSPNLLPPAPGLHSRSPRGSNDGSNDAGGIDSSLVGKVRRKLSKRRPSQQSLRGHNSSNAQPVDAKHALQHNVQEQDLYASGGKSPRRGYSMPLDVQQTGEGVVSYRSTSHRNELPTHTAYAYGRSPKYADRVIPDMAGMKPSDSSRNSRYTSGGSSVSEPVIPDISLIMEAERGRTKNDRVRRRLVPLQSSSEEGGTRYYDSDADLSGLDSVTDYEGKEGQDDGSGEFYKRPYRARDGYGSEYASEVDGGKSRPPSRPPSRSPSRGILKRSSSVCSQRSNKSVRLEIPKDRRALEEVRDAEDKVDSAERRLKDLLRHPGKRSNPNDVDVLKATEALNEARQMLKGKEATYEAIIEAMKSKKSERDESETSPRYV
ncbi:hypothetical protein M0805_002311 [Coniferiporia weirii]|nr:hypothetical protein M0805_002311 [Coniferiporia weirii]